MNYVAQRMGLRIPPGLIVLVLIIGALVGAAFWIGPFRPLPPAVELLVADGEGFAAQAALANAGTAEEPRFPLVLALRNAGGRVAHPSELHLSVPARLRLRSTRYALAREVVPGNPLVRYALPLEVGVLPPDTTAAVAVLDTVWLEPQHDDYHCEAMSDSIPVFAPAPRIDPERLASVQAFYSVRDGRIEGRQTGVVHVRLDARAFDRPALARPPAFPTQIREPWIPGPALGPLTHAGTRTALCGDPQQPLELFTSTWETPTGGRFLVVYLNGAPRKYLYDLNRDSIVELEMWDPDGDGRFEARRAARFPIPSFLLPERLPEATAALDSLANDPAWQQLVHDTLAGPYRFVPDTLRPPALRQRAPPSGTAVLPGAVPRPGVTAPDTAWLRRFHDTDAGPYRFAPNPPPRLVVPPPPPPRPRRDEPLGTPIPYPPPGNR